MTPHQMVAYPRWNVGLGRGRVGHLGLKQMGMTHLRPVCATAGFSAGGPASVWYVAPLAGEAPVGVVGGFWL